MRGLFSLKTKIFVLGLFVVSLFSGLLFPCSIWAEEAQQGEKYDPMNTMLALNLAIVSIHRIVQTKDKIVLDQEYQNIINNLALGNIESDNEMLDLYEEMMKTIKARTLIEAERERLKKASEHVQQRNFLTSLPAIFVPITSNLIQFIGGVILRDEAREIAQNQYNRNKDTSFWNSVTKVAFSIGHLFNLETGLSAGSNGIGINVKNRRDVGKFTDRIADAITDYQKTKTNLENDLENTMFTLRIQDFFRFTNLIGGIANVLVSQYLSYQNSKDAILSELNDIDWELTKEDIMTCDELQRKLLRSSWSLLRRYKLPDNLRLTQDNLDFWHSKVISETDPKIRMRHLINIEQDFQAYPPYWFHRGETALKIDDYAEAKKCFDKFNDVWRQILRRDPYKAEVEKYRIVLAFKDAIEDSEGKISEKKRFELFDKLGIILQNIPYDDWGNYNFIAMSYFILGKKDTAIACLSHNIDTKNETDISGVLLKKFTENDKLDLKEISSSYETIYVAQLVNNLQSDDSKKVAGTLALYFNGYTEEARLLLEKISETNENPIAFMTLWFIERHSTPTVKYWRELEDLSIKFYSNIEGKWQAAFDEIAPLWDYYFYKRNGVNNAHLLLMGFNYLRIKKEFYPVELLLAIAKETDDFFAEYLLGEYYFDRKDFKNAVEFFKKSYSHEKFMWAARYLGDIYSGGLGVQKDYKSAVSYYIAAAEQGNRYSQMKAGDLYYEGGNNLAQNYYTAYLWYQVYEFNDLEESYVANTVGTVYSNVVQLGGWLAKDETPKQRMDLIEGYGIFNTAKLSTEQRTMARDNAKRTIERINKLLGTQK